MTEGRKKTGRAAVDGVDAGLGTLLGTLGAALSEVIGRLDQGGAGEVRRDFEVETDRGPLRAQAGIRVRMGGFDTGWRDPADAREPAPVRAGAAAPEGDARPIATEIVDDGTVWRLTADLPGVARKDLSIMVEHGMLVLSAAGRGRRYSDRFAVPHGTGPEDLRVSLRHGVLEIEAPSAEARRP
jgi:HSP20 family molecular chaperone IbpA